MNKTDSMIEDEEKTILKRGAEAIIYQTSDMIIKQRIPKKYRTPELDQSLNKSRTKSEIKIIKKLNSLEIPTPQFIKYNEKNEIFTKKIKDCITVKEFLLEKAKDDRMLVSHIMLAIGKIVRRIHDAGIIHGDLTTTNFLVSQANEVVDSGESFYCIQKMVYVIDFGLSYFSLDLEDIAVDIYLFEKALDCVHDPSFSKTFLEGYFSNGENAELLLKLDNIRLRGRKR